MCSSIFLMRCLKFYIRLEMYSSRGNPGVLTVVALLPSSSRGNLAGVLSVVALLPSSSRGNLAGVLTVVALLPI